MSRQNRIEETLKQMLAPQFLLIENESFKHQVPDNAETHFKMIVVANKFEGMSLIARHRLINSLCKPELEAGLHALSLSLFTPEEWESQQSPLLSSPKCRGGRKLDL